MSDITGPSPRKRAVSSGSRGFGFRQGRRLVETKEVSVSGVELKRD